MYHFTSLRRDSEDAIMASMQKLELGYAAGFFDGEGSIMLKRSYKRRANGLEYLRTLRVTITQNDPRPLHQFSDIWGGAVSKLTRPNGNHYYRWTISTRKAERFLRDVQPYLIVKQADCELALQWQKLLDAGFDPHDTTVNRMRDDILRQLRKREGAYSEVS